ncbi:MAG: hypothetical protein H0U76_29150 [Ktedonobacteraceae bacterium]|nr:hypothetical protein [Ktedonobacteraceae bacterium]
MSVIVIGTEAFQIQKDPFILPIGSFISLIIELMAGLNFLYDRATKQFARFHLYLDRIIRASIAHVMAEDLEDKDKLEAIQKIVDNLLREDKTADFQVKDAEK